MMKLSYLFWFDQTLGSPQTYAGSLCCSILSKKADLNMKKKSEALDLQKWKIGDYGAIRPVLSDYVEQKRDVSLKSSCSKQARTIENEVCRKERRNERRKEGR